MLSVAMAQIVLHSGNLYPKEQKWRRKAVKYKLAKTWDTLALRLSPVKELNLMKGTWRINRREKVFRIGVQFFAGSFWKLLASKTVTLKVHSILMLSWVHRLNFWLIWKNWTANFPFTGWKIESQNGSWIWSEQGGRSRWCFFSLLFHRELK